MPLDASLDRRSFIRAAAATVLGVPAVACTVERQPETGTGASMGPPRPILLPWGTDAVRIAAPPRERPLAYVSHGSMQVWVDLAQRDRLRFALGAHISVSTAHWRIPLPGDPPNIPIQAGDARREFEEVDMRTWDAEMEPTEGDVRILRGAPTGTEIRIECQPLSGGGAWLGSDPLQLYRAGPPSAELTREDLVEVGSARRYADRDCVTPSGSARLVTWACVDPSSLEGV